MLNITFVNIRQLFPPYYSQNINAATQNIIFYYCNFSRLCSFLELLILVCLENYILTNHNHSFVFYHPHKECLTKFKGSINFILPFYRDTFPLLWFMQHLAYMLIKYFLMCIFVFIQLSYTF